LELALLLRSYGIWKTKIRQRDNLLTNWYKTLENKKVRRKQAMFKKILFCTDFSQNSDWAFTYALNLANNYKSKLFILHVTEAYHPDTLSSVYLPQERVEELRISKKKELDKELKTHYLRKLKEFNNYEVLFKEGEPFIEIIQMAKKESVDLIVMGTHGATGLDYVLFGSTADKVVKKSPCPVLTTPYRGKRFKMP